MKRNRKVRQVENETLWYDGKENPDFVECLNYLGEENSEFTEERCERKLSKEE